MDAHNEAEKIVFDFLCDRRMGKNPGARANIANEIVETIRNNGIKFVFDSPRRQSAYAPVAALTPTEATDADR